MDWLIRVPAHITGFFHPVITEKLETTGSIGAGFSIKKYVYTYVKPLFDKSDIRVFFNNKEATKIACTTISVAREILDKFAEPNIGLEIYHDFEVPIGCGLASSGAGALGTAFAINKALDLNIDKNDLIMAAHKAEISCKTGLGSVMGQFDGMFEIRVRAGGPEFGKVARYPMKENVAVLIYGPIETRNILSSDKIMKNIENAFGNKHMELLNDFSLDNFIKLSKKFAYETKLIIDRVDYLLKKASKIGLKGSMLMIGEGAFLFGEELEEKVRNLINSLPLTLKPPTVIISEIDNEGVAEVSGIERG